MCDYVKKGDFLTIMYQTARSKVDESPDWVWHMWAS